MMDCRCGKPDRSDCACKNQDCRRHGICCECVAHHREKGKLPACLRKPKPEAAR